VSVTFHDAFCGAGGSTLGALRAGAQPVLGLNHWQVACDTYAENHASSGADVLCADICTIDPRRIPTADVLLASPECTHHSYARGRPKDDPSLFDPAGDQGAERSRATMWDVPRFAEHHGYRAIVVENVVQIRRWRPKATPGALYQAWLGVMLALGYEHREVFLNAMVCGVPQSRDRIFVVFWRRGERAPDLEITPECWCAPCGRLVEGRQTFKQSKSLDVHYGAQYVYTCPGCRGRVAPVVRPAAAAIDWTLPAVRIGDRSKPLKPATLERIRRGLLRLGQRPLVIPLHHLADRSVRARPADGAPLPTQTARQEQGLVVAVGGNTFEREHYARAWPSDEPMPVVTATADRALVVPAGGRVAEGRSAGEPMHTLVGSDRLALALVYAGREHAIPRSAEEPMPCQTTINSLYLVEPFQVDLRGENRARPADGAPLSTIHALVTYRGGQDARSVEEPAPTLTTLEQQALLAHGAEPSAVEVEDCSFRMLQPHELKRGQDFDKSYRLHGNKRQQVAQIGNAVPAGAEHELVRRLIGVLA